MLHTTVASAMQVARAVMGQAVEDPGFEARYWAGSPDDNYARDIVDYGPSYSYSRHGFARYTGAGILELGSPPSARQRAIDSAYDERERRIALHLPLWHH
eukprot:COSAG02_NODE_4249_length_5586_cov_14.082377_1_plen_100_part_00